MDEVNKLLTAKFIHKVYYPKWLANVVMVKKAKGKMEDVRGFHKSKSSLPKRQLPFA